MTGRAVETPAAAAPASNRWTGQSGVSVSVQPAHVRPGELLRLTVRGLPADVELVWCHGGKLCHGFDAVYPLHPRASGAWSARLPVARYASSGPIRLCLYVAHAGGLDRHDIAAGAVRTVPVPPPAPPARSGPAHSPNLPRRTPCAMS